MAQKLEEIYSMKFPTEVFDVWDFCKELNRDAPLGKPEYKEIELLESISSSNYYLNL